MSPLKKKVVVLFGGKSGEHEVSIRSAASVIEALDRDRYEVFAVGIDKEGRWFWNVQPEEWLGSADGVVLPHHQAVTLALDPTSPRFVGLDKSLPQDQGLCDVVFPVLHGPNGEDGTVQGALELAGISYVGSGILGSALAMDKDRMKAVIAQAGLPVGPYLVFDSDFVSGNEEALLQAVEEDLGYPCFIKPANLGSSVGITRAKDRMGLKKAVEFALGFDNKIVIEAEIVGREIEVSVLGDTHNSQASLPGEIIPTDGFYDYEAKYVNDSARLVYPASLEEHLVKRLQKYACETFRGVDASGPSRVDFFVTAEGEIYVNEINTMPGFTNISMYSKLWEVSGVPYGELLDRLIEIGINRCVLRRNRQLV
ncbi:MAG: D-alanine--D-alanine ligase [Peptococcaceae bacterium]|nr:D-alanine--D-alanine ligase [Peptococcaceae bacterium]